MSNYDDDDTNDPGNLRDALKKANKRLADLENELKQAQAKSRRSDIKEVLENLKVPVKVAKLIPADVEPTKEAVKAWVDEYADVFGITTQTDDAPDGEPEATTQVVTPSVPPEYVTAMTIAAQTESTGIPPAPDPRGVDGKLDALTGKSFEEIAAAINSMRNLKG